MATGPAPRDLGEFESISVSLEEDGLTVLWVELTAPEVEGLGHVVKVVVPQMVPLSTRQDTRWLGTVRLHRAMGLSDPSISDFNPIPHPFA